MQTSKKKSLFRNAYRTLVNAPLDTPRFRTHATIKGAKGQIGINL